MINRVLMLWLSTRGIEPLSAAWKAAIITTRPYGLQFLYRTAWNCCETSVYIHNSIFWSFRKTQMYFTIKFTSIIANLPRCSYHTSNGHTCEEGATVTSSLQSNLWPVEHRLLRSRTALPLFADRGRPLGRTSNNFPHVAFSRFTHISVTSRQRMNVYTRSSWPRRRMSSRAEDDSGSCARIPGIAWLKPGSSREAPNWLHERNKTAVQDSSTDLLMIFSQTPRSHKGIQSSYSPRNSPEYQRSKAHLPRMVYNVTKDPLGDQTGYTSHYWAPYVLAQSLGMLCW
jgi:hypothetical protein